MLSVSLPVINKLLVVNFWGSLKSYVDFWLHKGWASNPRIAQGTTVVSRTPFIYKTAFGFKMHLCPWLHLCLILPVHMDEPSNFKSTSI